MAELVMTAVPREAVGSSAARKLRRAGQVPAVLYDSARNSRPLALDGREAARLAGVAAGHLVQLKLEGATQPVLVKEVQVDPISGELLHVDFHAVSLDRPVETEVPVVVVGEERREKDGGVLTHYLHHLRVRCLPTRIPDRVEVDVSALKVGQAVRVGDLRLPEGVEVQDDAEELVVAIAEPVKPEDAEARTEAAEPEVIGRRRDEAEAEA